MYNNIGNKIMVFAKVVCSLGFIASVLGGVVIAYAMAVMNLLGLGIFLGILVAVIGSLVSWISTWVMYGFGELIETAKKIEKNTR